MGHRKYGTFLGKMGHPEKLFYTSVCNSPMSLVFKMGSMNTRSSISECITHEVILEIHFLILCRTQLTIHQLQRHKYIITGHLAGCHSTRKNKRTQRTSWTFERSQQANRPRIEFSRSLIIYAGHFKTPTFTPTLRVSSWTSPNLNKTLRTAASNVTLFNLTN